MERDTVAAISTPAGEGGIGVIRISGPGAVEVLGAVVPHLPPEPEPRRIHVRWARDPATGERIDRVVAFVLEEGRSYTGEPTAEIQGHGGPVVMDRLLEAVLAAGARLAPAGEFTRRAFLGGRLDLVQAEAVAQLVSARGRAVARASAVQLAGGLSRELGAARRDLIEALARIEGCLDFDDHEVPEPDPGRLLALLDASTRRLERLAATWRPARALFEGTRVALAGPPNTGKSSLFNALVGRERSLVDPGPGTTRDYVEATVEIDGVPVTLVDTAGVRSGAGRIEGLGIELSFEAVRSADALLVVLDRRGISAEALSTLEQAAGDAGITIVLNKSDLPGRMDEEHERIVRDLPTHRASALTGEGLGALRRRLAGDAAHVDPRGALLATARHRDLVAASLRDVASGRSAIEGGATPDVCAACLRDAVSHLDALTGREALPDVLDVVFSRFCVGK